MALYFYWAVLTSYLIWVYMQYDLVNGTEIHPQQKTQKRITLIVTKYTCSYTPTA